MIPHTTNPLLETEPATLDDLRALARQGRLYAVIDACDAPPVPGKIEEWGSERSACLYQGDAERDFATIAPYLVHVNLDLVAWITETLLSEPWGIFIVADGLPGALDVVRRHLRKFLMVKGPDQKTLYFRYYDPRVLVAFLPACNEAELREFFGPVESFITAGAFSGEQQIARHAYVPAAAAPDAGAARTKGGR